GNGGEHLQRAGWGGEGGGGLCCPHHAGGGGGGHVGRRRGRPAGRGGGAPGGGPGGAARPPPPPRPRVWGRRAPVQPSPPRRGGGGAIGGAGVSLGLPHEPPGSGLSSPWPGSRGRRQPPRPPGRSFECSSASGCAPVLHSRRQPAGRGRPAASYCGWSVGAR